MDIQEVDSERKTGQPDLFGQPPANPLIGTEVRLPDPCKCGCNIALIGASKGPHKGSLHCRACERHRGWISRDTYDSITAIIAQWGRPDTPIVVRRGSSRQPEHV